MEPIRYVERLNQFYTSQGFQPYQWTVNERAPLAPLRKPLAGCRVSMLTAGGAVFVNFPMGSPFGRPFDAETDRRILLDALHLVATATTGGTLLDLPYDWGEPFSAITD